MYLIINNKRYTVSRRLVSKDTVKYLSVEPEPVNVSGTVAMFRDDGVPMSEDNADSYARHSYTGTLLVLTNAPEPVPVEDVPIEETPSQQRENAYNTDKLIPWNDDTLTVTEAAKLWSYYAAEGDTDTAAELTALIAEAKAEIRQRYPEVTDP